MTPGLGHVVELVFLKIEAADQRLDGAVTRVQCHKGAFHFGQLRDFPGVLECFGDPDHRPGANFDVRRRLVRQPRLRGFEAFTRDLKGFTVLAQSGYFFRVSAQHHRRHHVAVVRVFVQGLVNDVLSLLRVSGQCHKFLGPTVNLPALKVHDAAAQRLVSGILVRGAQGGVHVQTAGVGFLTVLRVHQLPHHFGHVLRVHFVEVCTGFDRQLGLLGGGSLVSGDEAVFQHAVNDVQLTRAGPLGVSDGVVG